MRKASYLCVASKFPGNHKPIPLQERDPNRCIRFLLKDDEEEFRVYDPEFGMELDYTACDLFAREMPRSLGFQPHPKFPSFPR
jgi:hypothetical protein